MIELSPKQLWNEIRTWLGPTRRNIPVFGTTPTNEARYFSAKVDQNELNIIKVFRALDNVPSYDIWGSSDDPNKHYPIDFWGFRPVAEGYQAYLTKSGVRSGIQDESGHTTYVLSLIHAFLESKQ